MTSLTLMSPLTGIIVPLSNVPDQVFAQRLVGDGISIDPLSQQLLAPCDARVVQLHRAGHAITLEAGGLEIMIHVGLDTVNLKGDGFTPHVQAGANVRTGDVLISFDADLIAQRARSLLTQVVITNMGAVAALRPRSGNVTAGRDPVLEIELDGAPAPAEATSQREAVLSAPIRISSAAGLHARPAALLATTARRFTSDLRLLKGDREANARSIVSLMALEVGSGETVRIAARGDDAAAAIAALAASLAEEASAPHAPTPVAATAARPPLPSGFLQGVAAAPGVAIGQVHHLRHQDPVIEARAADPNQERRELANAIASAHLQLEALQARLAAEAQTERAAIFGAHQALLEDPEVLDTAAAHIRNGASAAHAWREAYLLQAQRLRGLDNELLAGRAADLQDVGRRVLHLLVGQDAEAPEVPFDSIIIAEDLVPSEAASLDRTRVRGFATTMGSATSHVAILARALGIPAVCGIDPRALELADGTSVVLDGDAGWLHPDPTEVEAAEIARRQQAAAARHAQELAAAGEPAVTRDGHRMEIVANIGDAEEAGRVIGAGGEGVGLLRTEFMFLERRTAPDEAEQTQTYESIARIFGPDRILVIRTLDIGGDKPLAYVPVETEANPFLGERGIRLLLNRPELLRAHLRAMLRAASFGRVAIMFPMISTMAEWRAARAVLEEERAALGVPPVQVGIMVETASAALLADRFAEEADFLSIGTNDLTQYTLAMDRTNPRFAPQLDALHPAVLRLIERTVAGARLHKRWVGVCGALASDPQAVPVLIGLGIDELSVSVPAIPAIKARVRQLELEACRATARAALAAADAEEVRALVAANHGDIR